MPFYAIRFFEVRNLVFKFVVGVITPTLSIFRATEGKYSEHGFPAIIDS